MKSTMQSQLLKRKLLPALISAMLATGYAHAQQEDKKVADEKAANEIETIVVTATKRKEPLQ